jgi:uncharacterized UPF0160 family protein
VNTAVKEIPEIEHPELIFRHAAGFIAVFKSMEAAIEAALQFSR